MCEFWGERRRWTGMAILVLLTIGPCCIVTSTRTPVKRSRISQTLNALQYEGVTGCILFLVYCRWERCSSPINHGLHSSAAVEYGIEEPEWPCTILVNAGVMASLIYLDNDLIVGSHPRCRPPSYATNCYELVLYYRYLDSSSYTATRKKRQKDSITSPLFPSRWQYGIGIVSRLGGPAQLWRCVASRHTCMMFI